MLMGPVFRAELLRTSRQKRYYALRVVYGLVLLLLVWTGYEQMRRYQPVVSTADLARFASTTFIAFAVLQLVTILLLVPPIFGGAIADEKQRKTLHYLMASQLSGGEIILDKVLSRSSLLAIFVAIGLPVVSILALSGGISAESVLVAYVGTFSTAAFAVALTTLVSTWARRVRDAIVMSYILVLFWLLLPPLIFAEGTAIQPALYLWIKPVNDWLVQTSPLGVFLRAGIGVPGMAARPALEDEFTLMVGLQLAAAPLFLLVAIWRLRPIFRRQEDTPARRTWFRSKAGRRRSRWSGQPACGDDPIAWKERYFAPVDRFTRLVLLPAIVVITLPLALMTEVDGGLSRIFVDYWKAGLGARRPLPIGFLRSLQVDLGWYVGFWLLAVAGAAASAVTIEREKDTWVSLTATPLSGPEIIRGKVLGAIWNQRGFAAVLIFLWTLGLATGAVHPLGILTSIAVVGLLTWMVAMIGLYASLRASSTSRSLTSSLVVLSAFNGYPILVFLWFIGLISWDSSYTLLGAMPSLAAWSMSSPESVAKGWTIMAPAGRGSSYEMIPAGMGLGILLAYAAITLLLTWRVVGRFDRWLDRPPLTSSPTATRARPSPSIPQEATVR